MPDWVDRQWLEHGSCLDTEVHHTTCVARRPGGAHHKDHSLYFISSSCLVDSS